MSVTAIYNQSESFYCTQVQLLRGGKPYFSKLVELIQSATHLLQLHVYIFDDDETGVEIGTELMHAAQKGVQVQLMVDAFASANLSAEFIEQLQQEGILFKDFEPLLKSRQFYFGRRMHHKVVVADGARALVGGINISNRYNDMPGEQAWLDWALYVEGDVCKELKKVCDEVWAGGSLFKSKKKQPQQPSSSVKDPYLVRVRRNDWVSRKNQISRTYLQMFRYAEKNITIMSAYFLPGRVFRKSIEQALKRGVQFHIITAGYSDVLISKNAERFLYRWLLKRGVRIFEYQPTVLHGKLSVCDDLFVTAGSYNVNNISAYASIELNLDVYNPSFAQHTLQQLQQIIHEDCIEITYESYQTKYGRLARIGQWCCYVMFRFIFFLFTFYFKQKE